MATPTGEAAEPVPGLSSLRNLRRHNRHERAGFALYTAAVAAARDPWFYATLLVPDTLDGRFDLVALHAFLLVHRLQASPAPGSDLSQAVFDAMFGDMDNNLRELGVSDLRVGKRVRAMWEAFHGRSMAYAQPLDAADPVALAAALARNVWRGDGPGASPERLAAYVLSQSANIATQSLADLAAGKVLFLATRDALR
jgi:cytochrome b pre-mRNA-processing protein 3